MSYGKLIRKQVKKAFSDLKDLAVPVTLTRVAVTDYSFEKKEVVSSAPQVTTVKAVMVNKKNPKDPSETIQAQMIFNAEELDDPDSYDTVEANGVKWKFVPPYDDNGYTITINVARVV